MAKKGLIVISNSGNATEDLEKATRLKQYLESYDCEVADIMGPTGITPQAVIAALGQLKNAEELFVYIRDQISLGPLHYQFDGGGLNLEEGNESFCEEFLEVLATVPQNGTYIMAGPNSNLGTMDQISLKPEVLMISSGFLPGTGEHDQFDLERQLSGIPNFMNAAIAEKNRLEYPHNPPQDVKIWDHGLEI